MENKEESINMLNLQIGIIKDLHKQAFITKAQMETAIEILKTEHRKKAGTVTA